jgi:hypothetical protein
MVVFLVEAIELGIGENADELRQVAPFVLTFCVINNHRSILKPFLPTGSSSLQGAPSTTLTPSDM